MTARRLVWSEWFALILPAVAVLLLFLPAIVHPDYLLYPTFSPHSDLTVIHWPKAHLMHQTWHTSRQLPLWTPDNLSGMPLAANQLAMLFYPPAWLFLLLPPEPVFNALFIFHLLWAASGFYLLLRKAYELDVLPAVIGGLTFALSGKLLAHMAGGHASLTAAIAWMPWALFGLRMLLRSGNARWGLLAAASLAMQVTTHSLITLYTAYLLVAYTAAWAIGKAVQRDAKAVARTLPGLVAVPVVGLALGAVQILPLAELVQFSNRSLSVAEASAYALTPLQFLVGVVLPSAAPGHEYVIYLGLVPLVLAGLGIRRRWPESWFWAALILFASLFSLGAQTPLFGLAYRWLPGMHWVRTPARVFFLVAMAVSILAAHGAQGLARKPLPWSNVAAVTAGGFCLALGAGLAVIGAGASRLALGLAVLPALALAVIGLCVRDRLAAPVAQLALAALVAFDLLTFGLTMRRFLTPEIAFGEGAGQASLLSGQSGLFRTYSPSYTIPSHVAARAGLQTADGVEPVHLDVYDRFMATAGGYGSLVDDAGGFSVTVPVFPPDASLNEALRDARPDPELLGLLNVGVLVSAFPLEAEGLQHVSDSGEGFVYANSRVLPRAWLVPAGEDFVLPATYASGRSWLDALRRLARRATEADLPVPTMDSYGPNSLALTTDAAQPTLLVLSELWYPGWSATVDGQPVPVQPVAGLLRGVELPGGSHMVQLVYSPATVLWGARISLAAVVLLVAMALVLAWHLGRVHRG